MRYMSLTCASSISNYSTRETRPRATLYIARLLSLPMSAAQFVGTPSLLLPRLLRSVQGAQEVSLDRANSKLPPQEHDINER